MLTFRKTGLEGCLELQPSIKDDCRGRFVKTFMYSHYSAQGLATNFKEEYYSVSEQGVVRGVHFQRPPHAHTKLVYCCEGTVLDVIVDLRKSSPTFKQAVTVNLSAEQGNMIYIPQGFGHGFCVLSKTATLLYKVTSEYAQEFDDGILWSSIPIDWPINTPRISKRDAGFSSLFEFESPFD